MVKEVHQEVQVTLLQTTQSDIAHVYWIRRPEHTDFWVQGYIGVTKQTPERRFQQHVSISNRDDDRDKSIVHDAIKSIGAKNLEVKTILISKEDYCYEVEAKLRPDREIGWNLAIGGVKPPDNTGRRHSEESLLKMSDKKRGHPVSEETRKKLSDAFIGKPMQQGIKDKISKTWQDMGYWNLPKANREVWSYADVLYNLFLNGVTTFTACKNKPELFTTNRLQSMWKHFKNGWIPNQDEKWLSDFNKQEGI
jgi:hypothetical protein